MRRKVIIAISNIRDEAQEQDVINGLREFLEVVTDDETSSNLSILIRRGDK